MKILRFTLIAALASFALGVWFWSSPPMKSEAHVRFTKLMAQALTDASLPQPTGGEGGRGRFGAVATLRHETRYVLSAPREDLLVFESMSVPDDRTLRFSRTLPAELAQARAIALEIAALNEGATLASSNLVVEATKTAAQSAVDFSLDLPEGTAGTEVSVSVRAVEVEESPTTSTRSPPVAIPANAVLEFAIGVSQWLPMDGALEFIVSACEGEVCSTLFRESLDLSAPGSGWLDRRVPLETLAGQQRSFVFETRREQTSNSGASFPLWANPTIYARGPSASERRNVILLSLDTLSALRLESYGYDQPTAPFITETFGNGGTVFERCVAAATTTPQSHMSMFTGVYPCVHGVTTGFEAVRDSIATLGEAMAEAGYETGAVTENGWLGYMSGFGLGFSMYAENKSPNLTSPTGQIEATFNRAKDWILANRDRRFFLFLHTFQVHDPYTPPPRLQSLFRERDGLVVDESSPRPLRESVAYDQEIRYADEKVRDLFAFLEEAGLAENTVFILTSDHGEEFFEHGFWGHGPQFYEQVTHVPLMMWGPGLIPAGKRVAMGVSHIDIMPTILEVAGVPPPRLAAGTSLLPWLRETALLESLPERPLYSESHVESGVGEDYTAVYVLPPGYLVQRGPHKLARYRTADGFEYRYYDLSADPAEAFNRFDEGSSTAMELQAILDDYQNYCLAGVISSGASGRSMEAAPVILDPENQEKLRALGYFQ